MADQRSFVFYLVLSSLLAIFVWAGGANSAPKSQASVGPIVYGAPVRIGSLNPYLVSGIDAYTVMGAVFEPLARIDPWSQGLEPWLASGWKLNHAKKVIQVTLRPDVKFQGGGQLTAADVEFTFKSYSDPRYQGEIWRAMWRDVDRIEARSDLELNIHMKALTFQSFRNVMTAMRILPRGFYGDPDPGKWRTSAVGSGPYKVNRFEPNRVLELAPHESWWGAKAKGINKNDLIVVKSVGDLSLGRQMAKKGMLDFYLVPAGEPRARAGELVGARRVPSPFGRGFGLAVNVRSGALADARLRQALSALWNRQALNDKIFAGQMRLALDSFSPSRPGYPKGAPTAHDPALAKKLLREMGFKDINQDGVLERDVNGKSERLQFKALVRSAEAERWLGLFQADCAKAGIRIIPERVEDDGQWWNLLNKGHFDLLAYDGALSEAPHSPVFHSKGAYNTSGVKDAQLDAILEKLDVEFDSARRQELIARAVQRLRELAVEVPGLYHPDDVYLVSSRLNFDSRYPHDFWRWSVK